jgi:hypothetical protein
MRWRWGRTERRRGRRSSGSRADGADPLDRVLAERTMPLPLIVESSPLRTPAQRWRGDGGRSRTRPEVRR